MKSFLPLILLLTAFALVGCSDGDVLSDEEIKEAVRADTIFDPASDYILVLGDIQAMTYHDDNRSYLLATSQWIINNSNSVCCVLQTGDLTETNKPWEWKYLQSILNPVSDALPLIICTGNHDYDWLKTSDNFLGITDRKSTHINSLDIAPTTKMAVVSEFEKGCLENVLYKVRFAGDDLYILVLEFGPRREAVEWAESIVKSMPGEKFILMTHEWLLRSGELVSEAESYAKQQWLDGNYTAPDRLWNELVYPNDNIRAVLCGHNGFCKHRRTPNATGRIVSQILFNLQYQEHGGDGLVMLWRDLGGGKIDVSVYNIVQRALSEDPDTRFVFDI